MKQLLLFLICNLAFLLTVQGNSAEIPPAVMFKQLSTTEGLSNNSVRSIYRDNRGFLWVGTESGLNKYDGYSFQQYYQNNSDLPDDAISEIFEGPDDNVWIRTSSGYSIYNYKTGKFDNDYKPILDGLQIPSKNILRMGKTSKNEFWAYDYSKLYIRSMDNSSIKAYPLAVEKISNLYIGVQFIYIMYSNGTLYSISKQTSEVKEIAIPTIYRPLLENHEPHIYIDQNESLWVYTFQNSLLLHKNSFTQQWEDISLNNNTHIQYNRVQRILDLGDGNVWILTSHMGLFVYNTLTKSLTNLVHNPLKPHTIASNNLNTIYRDKDGTIYIGNFKHGISYYSPMSQIILCNKSLEYDDILTFCEDTSQEYIYYGTDGTGLIRRSLVTDSYEKIATPANIVVDLSIDSKNRLWIGTFQKGLLCYSKGQIKQYTVSNSQLLENNVYTVKVDKHGYIWIGTMKGYIQRLNPETGQFDTILYRPGEFFVRDMYYDKDSTLYVATKGGLIIIDTETQAYNIYAEAGRFKENNMLTVYKDSRDLLWIGHPHGLSIWNQKNDSTSATQVSEQNSDDGDLIDEFVNDTSEVGDRLEKVFQNSPFLMKVWNLMKSWGHGNKAFRIIATLPLFALATQLAFRRRKYKLNYNTTEHVFIQAYIACQILLLSIIVLPFNGYAKVDDLYELPLWLIFVLFCWDYKQLYRCTWWRSFWRTILMLTYSLVLLVIFACLVMALMLAGIYVLKFIL